MIQNNKGYFLELKNGCRSISFFFLASQTLYKFTMDTGQ